MFIQVAVDLGNALEKRSFDQPIKHSVCSPVNHFSVSELLRVPA
jgi:hypothetical protein